MSIEHIHDHIRETHVLSPEMRTSVVRADESDKREWLKDAPTCGSLSEHRIAHCGIMHSTKPFEIVRVNLSGTFFFACLEGQGQVLIDGEWRTVGVGQACVQPPFIPNALRTHRAAELLVTTDQKIAMIAQTVGYANQFAFSDTFKRWIGCRPSTYRQQKQQRD